MSPLNSQKNLNNLKFLESQLMYMSINQTKNISCYYKQRHKKCLYDLFYKYWLKILIKVKCVLNFQSKYLQKLFEEKKKQLKQKNINFRLISRIFIIWEDFF